MRSVSLATAFLIVCFNTASAEPGTIESWLMDKPVTLWDRGMDELKESAQRAHDDPILASEGRYFASVNYDWDNNEILATLWIYEAESTSINHEKCNEIRNRFIGHVVGIGGIADWSNTGNAISLINDIISRNFSHNGFQSTGRDENLGEKLANNIYAVVDMQGDAAGVVCKDKITSFHAPSKPTP